MREHDPAAEMVAKLLGSAVRATRDGVRCDEFAARCRGIPPSEIEAGAGLAEHRGRVRKVRRLSAAEDGWLIGEWVYVAWNGGAKI